jgi:hypothetical protein
MEFEPRDRARRGALAAGPEGIVALAAGGEAAVGKDIAWDPGRSTYTTRAGGMGASAA